MRNAAGEVLPRRAGQTASGIERGYAAFIGCKASLVGQRGEGSQKDVREVIWRPLFLCARKGCVRAASQ